MILAGSQAVTYMNNKQYIAINQLNYSRAKNPRFAVTEICMFFTGAKTCLHKFRPEIAPPHTVKVKAILVSK
jgi:hypothetical protein